MVSVAAGLIIIIAGGTALLTGVRTINDVRAWNAITTGESRRLQPGASTTIRGASEPCGETVTAPLTGTASIAAGILVEKRKGTGPGWTPVSMDARGVPFRIRDYGTDIEVDAGGVEYGMLRTRDAAKTTEEIEKNELPASMWDSVEFHPTTQRYKITEICLEPSDLTVVGNVRDVSNAETTCSGTRKQVMVSSSSPFCLSDLGPSALKRQYRNGLLRPVLLFWVMVAAIAYAAIFL